MIPGKTLLIAMVTLIVGFGAGFIFRPIIAPSGQPVIAVSPASAVPAPAAARGTQYFAANLGEARRIVAECQSGSVRSDECANADHAITEAEGRDRFKKFMGH